MESKRQAERINTSADRLTPVLLEWLHDRGWFMLVADDSGQVIFANDAARNVLGVAVDEPVALCLADLDPALGAHWLEREHPRWQPGTESIWERAVHGAHGRPLPSGLLLKAVYMSGVRHLVLSRQETSGPADVVLVQEYKRTLAFVQGITDAFPDFLFEGSVDGRYLNTWTKNPELLAASREFLVGHTLDEVLSPESAAIAKEAFREAGEQGVSFGKVISVDTDLGRHWYELSVSKMSMGEGREPHFITVSRDVTARLSLQTALADKERQFRTLVENSSDLIARFDPLMRCLYANPAFAERTGLPVTEMLGGTPVSALGPWVGVRLRRALVKVFGSAQASQFELDWTDVNGRRANYHITLTPELGDQNEVSSVLVVGRDIHELRAYQNRLHRLVESNIIGVLFWRPDGVIVDANDAILQLLGYSRSDLVLGSLKWSELTPPGHERADALASEQVTQSGACRPYEKELQHRDGRLIPVLVGSALLDSESQEGVSYVLDLTEQRRAEQAHRARESAEAASRAKSEFLARMSHEIRTPLNAVMGLAYLCGRETREGQTRERMQQITGAGRSLLHLINDILDHTKIEEGLLKIEHVPFDLQQVLDNVAVILGAANQNPEVEIVMDALPLHQRQFIGDPARIEQVLINLTGNALKFTHKGVVALSVRGTEQDADTTFMHFSVQDTGIGIDRDKIAQLFNPFVQADPSVSRRFGGSGLGLSICKRLVKLMDGDIGADSTSGSGSTFWFSLPMRRAQATVAASFLTAVRVRLQVPSARTAEVLQQTCEHLGWQVVVSGEVDPASASLTAPQADVVIVEWPTSDLPDVESLKRQLLQLATTAGTLKLVLTGGRESSTLIGLVEDGLVDAVLTKPMSVASLVTAVHRSRGRTAGFERAAREGGREDSFLSLRGARVLVVDDSEVNRELACGILASHGAEVMDAASGEEALERLVTAHERCDVVLMDVHMPGIGGLEATVRIRRQPELEALPVIALTASAFADERRAALRAGMSAVVTKPFDVDNLVQQVARLAKGRHTDASGGVGPDEQAATDVRDGTDLIDPAQGLILWQDRSAFHRNLGAFLHAHDRESDHVAGLSVQELMQRAHKVRGTAAALTLKRAAQRAYALEEQLRLGGQAHQLCNDYLQTVEQTCWAIRRYLERAG